METSDYLLRGVIKPLKARFALAETTNTVCEGIRLHDADPVSGFFYGRALTVGALISPLLENQEKYSLRWDYEGKIGKILVEANAANEIRGLLKEPHLYGQVETEDQAYGDEGKITLVKSQEGKILNSGSINAGLMEVVDDIGMFFSVSDQIETEIVSLIHFSQDPENPVRMAAGFMLQEMPGCDLDKFTKGRDRMKSDEFKSILCSEIQEEKKLWKLVQLLMKDWEFDKAEDLTYTFGPSPQYQCSCSREKMLQAISVLEPEDIEDIFLKRKFLKIKCEFCSREYAFRADEIPQK